MTDEPIEAKVAVLDALLKQSSSQWAEERAILREDLRQIKTCVHGIENRLASVNWCPKPGTCLSVEKIAAEHDARLRSLEDTRTEAKAGWKVIAAIIAALSAGSAALGAWLAR